jgi:hypothetical protein
MVKTTDSTRNQFKAGQLWLTQQKNSEIVRAFTPCIFLFIIRLTQQEPSELGCALTGTVTH